MDSVKGSYHFFYCESCEKITLQEAHEDEVLEDGGREILLECLFCHDTKLAQISKAYYYAFFLSYFMERKARQ